MRLFLWISILFFNVQALAHEPSDGQVYAAFGPFTYMTNTLDHQFESPVLVGPALTTEADVSRWGGVEIGFAYLNNPFSVRRDNLTIVETVKRIYITTGYRHWFTPKFSLALAFSSSYIMGDRYVLRDDYKNSAISRPRTSASDITEYGLDASFQIEPWREGRWSVVIDGRYGRSLTPKRGEDSDHSGILMAVKYFVQSREKIPDDEE